MNKLILQLIQGWGNIKILLFARKQVTYNISIPPSPPLPNFFVRACVFVGGVEVQDPGEGEVNRQVQD